MGKWLRLKEYSTEHSMDLHWMRGCFHFSHLLPQSRIINGTDIPGMDMSYPWWFQINEMSPSEGETERRGESERRIEVCARHLLVCAYVRLCMDLATQTAALSMSYRTPWKLSTESHFKHFSWIPRPNSSPECLRQLKQELVVGRLLVTAPKNMHDSKSFCRHAQASPQTLNCGSAYWWKRGNQGKGLVT